MEEIKNLTVYCNADFIQSKNFMNFIKKGMKHSFEVKKTDKVC